MANAVSHIRIVFRRIGKAVWSCVTFEVEVVIWSCKFAALSAVLGSIAGWRFMKRLMCDCASGIAEVYLRKATLFMWMSDSVLQGVNLRDLLGRTLRSAETTLADLGALAGSTGYVFSPLSYSSNICLTSRARTPAASSPVGTQSGTLFGLSRQNSEELWWDSAICDSKDSFSANKAVLKRSCNRARLERSGSRSQWQTPKFSYSSCLESTRSASVCFDLEGSPVWMEDSYGLHEREHLRKMLFAEDGEEFLGHAEEMINNPGLAVSATLLDDVLEMKMLVEAGNLFVSRSTPSKRPALMEKDWVKDMSTSYSLDERNKLLHLRNTGEQSLRKRPRSLVDIGTVIGRHRSGHLAA